MQQRRNPYEGFVDSSPRNNGKNYDWLSDDLYNDTLAIHDVLWRYAVVRFKKEADCPIMVIGYGSLPIAIELSQWTYPVDYIAQSESEARQVANDNEHQAGFMDIHILDPYVDVPKARVCIFTGLLGQLKNKREILKWMDILTRRCTFVVCAEMTGKRDWKKLLSGRYHVKGLWYNRKQYTFLEIRRKGGVQ